MRAIHRLSVVKVTSLKRPGYYADGGSLYLRVAPGGSKGWIFRFTIAGRTRDAGLGAFPTVSLIKAREQAAECRRLVADGADPIDARKKDREAARIAAEKAITFEQCAKAFMASHEAGWRSDIHRRQWRNSLAAHVYPVIGTLPVQAVDTTLVLKVLESAWKEKPETASRVRQRIERVLNWAKVRGYREGENPAVWRGHLDQLLPPKRKVRQVAHHAAMPYSEISTLMEKLRADTTLGARALEFLILTATRTSEALGALWDEVDLEQQMWTIPARRMKAGREHRVPLSARAIAILNEMAEIRHNEFVFPGAKQGRPLTRNVLLRLLQRLSDVGPVPTPHGFRSSFQEWAAEATNFPREAAELALAHAVGDSVERAYQRGDLLEKRRKLMDAWAMYCARKPHTANIVPIKGRVV